MPFHPDAKEDYLRGLGMDYVGDLQRRLDKSESRAERLQNALLPLIFAPAMSRQVGSYTHIRVPTAFYEIARDVAKEADASALSDLREAE